MEQETFVYLGSATSTTTDGDGAANDSIAFNDLDDTHDQSYTDDHEHVQSPVEIKSEEEAIFVKDLREILKAQQVSCELVSRDYNTLIILLDVRYPPNRKNLRLQLRIKTYLSITSSMDETPNTMTSSNTPPPQEPSPTPVRLKTLPKNYRRH